MSKKSESADKDTKKQAKKAAKAEKKAKDGQVSAIPGATIEDAILLAVKAHRGQVERDGSPYVLHPLRVMNGVTTDTERIIAVLHDVVEDTDTTLDDLRQMGYSDEIVAAIDCVSRREGESYEAFIQRIKPNPLAVRVKLCDLMDNMDIRRAGLLQPDDLERFQRYQTAWFELTKDYPFPRLR
jgi:(p)ppGpp synthase/HD superfamily hydrolase